MKPMDWKDYYERFYDWAPSTQKSYARRLQGFGPATEVWEVAQEFLFDDKEFAVKFLERALEAGVRFTPELVLEMVLDLDKPMLARVAESTSVPFTRAELEEIYGNVDEKSFARLSTRAGIDIFADEEEADFLNEEEAIEPPPRGIGILSFLAGLALGGAGKRRDNGRCDGDCINCPPHYGYRYGRWYYGKDHQWGCQRGGNKGGGSML